MQSIEQRITELDRAISQKKIETIYSLYSPDARLVKQPGDVASGINEIVAHYEALFALNIPMTVTTHVVETIIAGDCAMVTSKWSLEGTDPDGNKGSVDKVANMVFTKSESRGWLLLIDNPFGPEILSENST